MRRFRFPDSLCLRNDSREPDSLYKDSYPLPTWPHLTNTCPTRPRSRSIPTEARLTGDDDGLGAMLNRGLGKNRRDVIAHGFLGDAGLLSDLGVRQSTGDVV